jgi:phosphatidylglycerol:prolipoprotein diacylglycerol transferase
MSYHGGVIGGVLSILIYSAVKRFDYREIGDMFAASIPLGFTFGRLGNFANGELYGRVTAGPWGMVFPTARHLPVSEPWVQEVAAQAGIDILPGMMMVNLPRYPSQLFQALFEGVVLWAIIWVFRNRKPFKGFLIGLYLAGIGLFRFVIEYFREPDLDIGYIIDFARTNEPLALTHPLLSFSTGQVLSFAMLVIGVLWLLVAARLPYNKPTLIYLDSGRPTKPTDTERKSAKKSRRKLRKKLR